jgi:hypothetical protein
VIKGIKCALACLGICDDFMAEPFHRFRAEERAQVQRCLPELTAQVERLVSNHQPGDSDHATLQPQPVSDAGRRSSSWDNRSIDESVASTQATGR